VGVAIHELWVLLDIRIAPGWFHVCIVILTRSVDEKLLSVVIPLRPSHPSSFN
jgi:hypothetical protein